jgi:hypothetical protein
MAGIAAQNILELNKIKVHSSNYITNCYKFAIYDKAKYNACC